ncbi:MAG: hydroxyacylglutathione hydrolase [Deltaproteobacteria bacterium]|nr:hydroxyacylglutathione hydrolase [Deltaproteobacteria bacterium]
MSIQIVPIFDDNYVFILPFEGLAWVIDPGDPIKVSQYLQAHGLQLDAILQTHHHWDHTDGAVALKEKYPSCVVYTPYFQKGRYPVSTHMLKEGDQLNFAGWNFTVMQTPGHTYDHISYYDINRKVLFCGDTLFNMGCGRVFDGSYEQLFLSLQKIKALPDDVQVYCTHEYTLANINFVKSVSISPELLAFEKNCLQKRKQGLYTIPFTLGENKKLNPFLLASDKETFTELRQQKDRRS